MVLVVYVAPCPYSGGRQQAGTVTPSARDLALGLQRVSSLCRLLKGVNRDEDDWEKGHHFFPF